MISGPQIRAARALLDMSATELSEKSGVGWSTIQRFENVKVLPKTRSGTLDRIKQTLEAEGIVFTGDPNSSPGVQLYRKASKEGKDKKRKGRPASKSR